ncbi:MAG: hypothetical protein Ta2A_26940 [Treponemataceae bacterium]|nr:MAG: hypothetical protein Ta2A_26940 [Treponemataceae bacterium]
MPRLTEAEYAALDEELTNNPPDVESDEARRPVRMVVIDDFSADWLRIKAVAEHTTEDAVLASLVREKIAAQST